MCKNLLVDRRRVLPSDIVPRKETAGKPHGARSFRVHTVLVVEHRDEVFARLAADLCAVGVGVKRAVSAAQALRRYARRSADLVLCHVDLPDQSSWLLTAKLRLSCPAARVWVYTPRSSAAHTALARFVQAEELIEYGGDLWRLSAELRGRLGRATRRAGCPVVKPGPAAWLRVVSQLARSYVQSPSSFPTGSV
jgi:DNA-binding response OmpR family regulator